jgi:hypothetical protein
MRRLLALAGVALLVSCKGITVSDADPFVGVYGLVAVDGIPLPVLGSDPGADPRREVVRVDVSLMEDHTASRVEYTRVTAAGQSSVVTRDERAGSFSLNGAEITLDFPGSIPWKGSIGGEAMFLTQGTGGTPSVHFYRRDRTFE